MLTDSKESLPVGDLELDRLVDIANKAVDAAGEIILKHYLARGNVFKVPDATNIPSWTNIASEAEKAMISLILKDFPCHAVCGKQVGWSNCSGTTVPEFVWVFDLTNGVEERLLPTFGMSIAVVHNGKPVIGCINNPITGIKTVGRRGKTTRNGDLVRTRASEHLEQAYVDIKDPGYNKEAKYAYNRLAYKVGETFFNGNCIAYSELAAGMLQVVVDCAVEPYGLLGLVPIVEGAGGIITDWQGNQLSWQPSPGSSIPRDGFKVVAASDLTTHQQIISELS
ncbi:bifunctional phosphatase IMPL2, chloroplastic-like [Lycium ferocissimum]|uniref:bifunctional phosphatase IMPL2, chloroplastic-like n=1 Tax=Lycium ferocissimum TaxID=112874 RepID=UPI0028164BD1|nr:bifunctional phosphatase IMPL2, chloroplastic-like [Lycium ferocissimum]